MSGRGRRRDPGLDWLCDRRTNRRLDPVTTSHGSRFPPLDELVHPDLGLDGNVDLLTEQAENLMHAGSFREVDVRAQALLFILPDLFGIEIIVDVAGDDIGIGALGA